MHAAASAAGRATSPTGRARAANRLGGGHTRRGEKSPPGGRTRGVRVKWLVSCQAARVVSAARRGDFIVSPFITMTLPLGCSVMNMTELVVPGGTPNALHW